MELLCSVFYVFAPFDAVLDMHQRRRDLLGHLRFDINAVEVLLLNAGLNLKFD